MSALWEAAYHCTACALSACSSVIGHYSSKLGSKFLSRYYGVGPANVATTASDIYQDKDHWYGAVAGFFSSWGAGEIASAHIGKAIGSFLGGSIAPIVGAIGGTIVGYGVGYVVSSLVNKLTDSLRASSGIFPSRSPGGSGGPGGVEFRKMEPLSGFDKAEIILSRKCNLSIKMHLFQNLKVFYLYLMEYLIYLYER